MKHCCIFTPLGNAPVNLPLQQQTLNTTLLPGREGKAASTLVPQLSGRGNTGLHRAVLEGNWRSCLSTLDINDLKLEGPVKSPHEETDQKWKWKADAGPALALAASAAQPS